MSVCEACFNVSPPVCHLLTYVVEVGMPFKAWLSLLSPCCECCVSDDFRVGLPNNGSGGVLVPMTTHNKCFKMFVNAESVGDEDECKSTD